MNDDSLSAINKNLENIARGVNTREHPTGVYHAIGEIRDSLKTLNSRLEELNTNIKEVDSSSSKLTEALNKITLAGVVISGLLLIWEIFKSFF